MGKQLISLNFENGVYICKIPFDLKDLARDSRFGWTPATKTWNSTTNLHALNLKDAILESIEEDNTIELDETPAFSLQIKLAKEQLEKTISGSSKLASDFAVPSPAGLEYLPYQKAGIEFAVSKGNALFADEMGLGKTIQAIGVINYKNAKSVLVVCPATLKTNWKRELKKWIVDKSVSSSINIIKGKKDFGDKESNIDIINYDIVESHLETLLEKEYDYLVFDESHYLKNNRSKRAIACLQLKSKNFLALTGTPFLNNPYEVFTVANKLSPSTFKTYGSFGYRYCSGQFKGTIHPSNLTHMDELQTLLKEAGMVRRLKADVLTELPDKIHSTLPMPVDNPVLKLAIKGELNVINKTRAAYEKITKAMGKIAKNSEQYEKANSELKALRRGFYNDLSTVRKETAVAKAALQAEYIIEMLEEQPKIVFFAHHKEVLDIVQKKLTDKGISVSRVDGSVTQEKRQIAIDSFQTQDTQVFIGSIRACGEGITLTASSTVVFGEMDWTPAKMMQCEDRCHRIGQKNCVSVINIVLENSIDDFIASKLEVKKAMINKLLNENIGEDLLMESTYTLEEIFSFFSNNKEAA